MRIIEWNLFNFTYRCLCFLCVLRDLVVSWACKGPQPKAIDWIRFSQKISHDTIQTELLQLKMKFIRSIATTTSPPSSVSQSIASPLSPTANTSSSVTRFPIIHEYLRSIKRPARPLSFFPNIPVILKNTHHRLPNQAVFKVPPFMNRFDISNYLTSIYNIPVLQVHTINYDPRIRRDPFTLRRTRVPAWKKAYVTIGSSDGSGSNGELVKVELPPSFDIQLAELKAKAGYGSNKSDSSDKGDTVDSDALPKYMQRGVKQVKESNTQQQQHNEQEEAKDQLRHMMLSEMPPPFDMPKDLRKAIHQHRIAKSVDDRQLYFANDRYKESLN